MNNDLDVDWLAERLQNRSMRGIAMDTAALIRSGAIEIGSRLPAVRDLAQALGVSPATVSGAWSQLRRQNVVTGRGRNGVWVSGDRFSPRPLRFEQIGNFGEHIIADMLLSSPDPSLLPDLKQALLCATQTDHLHSYVREPIMPVLLDAVKPSWPYQADGFMATDGGFDGMNLVMQTLILPGSVVAIEDPTASRLLDILDNLGAQVISVPCDEFGPQPEYLATALSKKPVAFIYQPRTHSHCGHIVSDQRFSQLAALLQDSDALILEDDGIGEISAAPARSMGIHFPERTLHVRSYSKVYGPDMRIAVLSGPHEMLKLIRSMRNYGAGWTSRLLQHATAWLINDAATQQGVVAARKVYAERREALAQALRQRGIEVPQRDGFSLYLAVPSKQYALVTLAARGFAVLPFDGNGQFIRISTSQLQAELVEQVADAIALVYG